MDELMVGGVIGGVVGIWSDCFEQGLYFFIEEFNVFIGFDLIFFQEDFDGLIVYVWMFVSVGVIMEGEVEQLVEGLDIVCVEVVFGSFQFGLVDEDVYFVVECWLIVLFGFVGKKLYIGCSCNDQVGIDLCFWLW